MAQVVSNKRGSPSFAGRSPASAETRSAAQGASKKEGTKCELALRRALWALGLRYRKNVPGLPGRPDLVFSRARLVVFCDGDFWHGRDLQARLNKLTKGHNAPYWVAKIQANAQRDQATTKQLQSEDWEVIRLWETDILSDPIGAATIVADRLRSKRPTARNGA